MKFLRTHSQRHPKLGKNRKKIQKWRRPNGRDNKIREGKRGHPKAVSIGFKKPRTEKPISVHNLKELEQLTKNQAALLAKIGAKKKLELIKKAKELKITLLNLREPKGEKKMKLEQKKDLASRTLNVGKGRIVFNKERLSQIKEAITKQDIRDLFKEGVISIKEIKGSRAKIKRKTRRRFGSKKKNVRNTKQAYVKLTRKLRAHIKSLKRLGQISPESYKKLRSEIKAKSFKDKSHFKERIAQ